MLKYKAIMAAQQNRQLLVSNLSSRAGSRPLDESVVGVALRFQRNGSKKI